MSDRIECRDHGRDFPEGEIAWLRKLIAGPPAANRHGLSKEFCRRIGWLKPDGGLKDMMARVTMLAMHDDGLIVLSPPKWKQNRPGPIVFGQDTEPPLFPPPTTLDEGQAAGDPHRRRRYAAGEALERVRRPPPLSRLQDLRRRADALRRPRPQRLAARHDRLQHRRMGARSTGPLHRMDSDPAQEEPAARHRRPPVPNPASGSASPNLGSHVLARVVGGACNRRRSFRFCSPASRGGGRTPRLGRTLTSEDLHYGTTDSCSGLHI